MKEESYPLVREAYAVVDGIPADRFNLRTIANKSDPHNCGTVACAAGWLAMHPKFKALGLGLVGHGGGYLNLAKDGVSSHSFATILSDVLNIDLQDAKDIFNPKVPDNPYDPPKSSRMSDKSRWKYRVRKFLELNP